MQRLLIVLTAVSCAGALFAETHLMTLRQAVERALEQNPDIAMARLDEQKAAAQVRLTKAPFSPTIGAGSGLAYANGFPMSVEGSAPSIVQARASQSIFNRKQSYLVAEAREGARGAGIATAEKREEIAYRTASLFADAQRAAQLAGVASKQVESLQKVSQTVQDRVSEGRELPIETKRADLEVARARQRVEQLDSDREFAERSLAVVLGFGADERVQAKDEPLSTPAAPATEAAAVESALESSKELRRLESALIAKGLDVRAQKAARLPTIDLIAQYGLFAKFNHYADYFRTFQRNNGEIGMSFQIPVLPGSGMSAAVAQAESEAAHLRIEMNAARDRISLDTRQSYQALRKAETARDVARLDLEVAREQVSVLLAQKGEGRASLDALEKARAAEDEKWIAFYDTEYSAEKAAWDLLRQTGQLMAALQ